MDPRAINSLREELENYERMVEIGNSDYWSELVVEARERYQAALELQRKTDEILKGVKPIKVLMVQGCRDENNKNNKNAENEDDTVDSQGIGGGFVPNPRAYVVPGAGLIQRKKKFSFGMQGGSNRSKFCVCAVPMRVPVSMNMRVRYIQVLPVCEIFSQGFFDGIPVSVQLDASSRGSLDGLGAALMNASNNVASGQMFSDIVACAERFRHSAVRTVSFGVEAAKGFMLFLSAALGLGICAFANVIPTGVSAVLMVLLGFVQCGFPTHLYEKVKDHIRTLVDYVSQREEVDSQGDFIVAQAMFETPAHVVEAFVHLLYNGLSLSHLATVFGESGPNTRCINQLRKLVQERERDRKGASEVAQDVLYLIQHCIDWVGDYTGFHFDMMSTGTPEVDALVNDAKQFDPQVYNEQTFVQLETIIRRCVLLKDKYRKVPRVDARLQVALMELEKIRAKFTQANLHGEMARKAPLSLLFAGPSQIGKSAAVSAIISAIMIRTLPKDQALDFIENSTKYTYTRTPECKFWDGYAFQPCVVLDDFGQSVDAAGNQENEYLDFIRMSNVFPYNLHMAKLETKGNSYFNSRLIVATSNLPTVKCASIHDSKAVTNRFEYFYVAPKKKFCVTEEDDPWARRVDETKLHAEFDRWAEENGKTFCTSTYDFYLVDTNVEERAGKRYKLVKKMSWDKMIDWCADKYINQGNFHESYIEGLNGYRMREFEKVHGPIVAQSEPMDVDVIAQSSQIEDDLDTIVEPLVQWSEEFLDGIIAQASSVADTIFEDAVIDPSEYEMTDEDIKLVLPPLEETWLQFQHSTYYGKVKVLMMGHGSFLEPIFIMMQIPKMKERYFRPKEVYHFFVTLERKGLLEKWLALSVTTKEPDSIKKRLSKVADDVKTSVSGFYGDLKDYLDKNPMVLQVTKIALGLSLAAGAIALAAYMRPTSWGSTAESTVYMTDDDETAEGVHEIYEGKLRKGKKTTVLTRKFKSVRENKWEGGPSAPEDFGAGAAGFESLGFADSEARAFGSQRSDSVDFLVKHARTGACAHNGLSPTRCSKIMASYNAALVACGSMASAIAAVKAKIMAGTVFKVNTKAVTDHLAECATFSHSEQKKAKAYFGKNFEPEQTIEENVLRIARERRLVLNEKPLEWIEQGTHRCKRCIHKCIVLGQDGQCLKCAGLCDNLDFIHGGKLSDIRQPTMDERNEEVRGHAYNSLAVLNAHEVVESQNGAQDHAGVSAAVKQMRRNTYALNFCGKRRGFVQFVAERIFIIPGHYVRMMDILVDSEEKKYAQVTKETVVDLVNDERVISLTMGHIIESSVDIDTVDEGDVMACIAPNAHQHSDIRKQFFEDDKLPTTRNFRVLMTQPADRLDSVMVAQMADASIDTTPTSIKNEVDENLRFRYVVARCIKYRMPTKAGDCGSMVQIISSRPGARFMGVHIAGMRNGDYGYAAIVTKNMLDEAVEYFSIKAQSSFLVAEEDWRPQVFSLPRGGNFEPLYWSPYKVSAPVETKIIPSALMGSWGESQYMPAKLRPFVYDGEKHDPYFNALGVYGGQTAERVPQDVIEACTHDYFRVFSLATKGFSKRQVYSFEEAVKGIDGESFINSIPRGTSQGYKAFAPGERPNKMAYFGDGEVFDLTRPKCLELKKEIAAIIEAAKRGERVEHIYTDFLKDERRKSKKALAGKTRMISACPMPLLIVTRMYFLAFIDALMSTRMENGVAIGINPLSLEWDLLARKMESKGSKVFAGDFTGFDGSEMPQIHEQILHLINRWYNDSEENQTIRRVLFADVFNSKHVGPGGAIYSFTHALPSGHPLTTPINSVYNNIAFRYCWYRACGNKIESIALFSEHVYLCAFGDDNVLNISDWAAELPFNQHTCTEHMAELGLTYTSETKDETPPPHRTLSEINFLKRMFLKDRRLGAYVAPLELGVLKETPYWTKRGDKSQDITIDNVEAVARELSIHPQKVWDDYFPQLSQAALDKLDYVTTYSSRSAYFALQFGKSV